MVLMARLSPRSHRLLRGDLHLHSTHRRCEHPAGVLPVPGSACDRAALAEMSRLARDGGMEYFALVNHASDPRHPHVVGPALNAQIIHHLNQVLWFNARRIPSMATVLAGVEISVLPEGGVDVDASILSHLDLVIVGQHSAPPQHNNRTVTRLFRVLESPHVDILSQPSFVNTRLSRSQWEVLVHQARRTQTAIEFSLRQPVDPWLARAVARAGVWVALGSDAHHGGHAPAALVRSGDPSGVQLLADVRAAGVAPSRILNLRSFDRLTRWLVTRT